MANKNPSYTWWRREQTVYYRFQSKLKSMVIPKRNAYYSEIISTIASELKPKVYVEIGIFRCDTFNLVAPFCELAIGVDVVEESADSMSGENVQFVLGDREVLKSVLTKQKLKVDLVFIDGDHSSEEVVKDFSEIEGMLAENALVILHDTWPMNAAQAGTEFCSDAWKAPNKIRNRFPQYSVVTLPIHPGMTFVQKSSSLPNWIHDES
jgi:hypothetical protein